MKKITLWLVLVLLFLSNAATACIPDSTAYYRLDIYDLKVDMRQLRSLCLGQKCVIDNAEDTIIIRSIFDRRVAVEIGKDSVALQLPLKKNIFGQVKKGYKIDPVAQKFAWKECARQDLQALQALHVIEINAEDIETIVALVQPGGKIAFEKGAWKGYGANSIRVKGGADHTWGMEQTRGIEGTLGTEMAVMHETDAIVETKGGCGAQLEPIDLPEEDFFNP